MVRGIITNYIYSEVMSHIYEVLRLFVHVCSSDKADFTKTLLAYVHAYTPPYAEHLFVNRAFLKKPLASLKCMHNF